MIHLLHLEMGIVGIQDSLQRGLRPVLGPKPSLDEREDVGIQDSLQRGLRRSQI